ncbi:MAG: LemA family protein [Nitrospiraceae bacterium]|nr:LemA family protein [Nitrospiraceae bacterium]
MNKKAVITIGVVAVFLLSLYSVSIGTYNDLVRLDENVKNSWAQVENQLQRRFDLIPNLVNTVKGYAKHEKEVFVQVTEARSQVARAGTVTQKIASNNALSSALSRLLVVVERYPELKANENFLRLQDELAGTENRLAVERKRYNDAVKIYNIKIRSFPTNVVARMFGFTEGTFFKPPKAVEAVPKVKF